MMLKLLQMKIELGSTRPTEDELVPYYNKLLDEIAKLGTEFVKTGIRGKALLQQQSVLNDKLQAYYRGIDEKDMREARKAKVLALNEGVEKDQVKVYARYDALVAQLEEARWAAQLRFMDYYHQMLRSYLYRKADKVYDSSLTLDQLETQGFGGLRDALIRECNIIDTKLKSRQTWKTKEIVVSTTDEGIFSKQWGIGLKDCLRVDFMIPPRLPSTVPDYADWNSATYLGVDDVQ